MVAGLRRDDEFIAIGLKVLLEDFPKVTLSGAGGRAIVVGQIKMGDAMIEGSAQQSAGIFKIIDISLGKLFHRITDLGYKIELTEKAKDFLANKGYDQQYGARPLNRAIQKYLEDAIAEEILKGDLSEGDVIIADYVDEATELTLSVNKKEKAD